MTPPSTRKDSIDRFVDSSLALFPGVDPETEAAVDRIHMLSKRIKRSTEGVVARFGLNAGEFYALLKLRVAPNQQMSAGDLAELLDLSTGAMTNRLDGLEEHGLITRERAAADRRSVLVAMTPKGQETLVNAVEAAGKEEHALFSTLSEAQHRQLNALLRSLVLTFQDPDDC
ncbi:MAG TPA: MarR family transcriptional regulator [Actinomycetota bacterium]|jgi:DNA-binding MarR family transcriptional regulator|nr:MarR family transcriptional regulator [Actinomycetota bacterium]